MFRICACYVFSISIHWTTKISKWCSLSQLSKDYVTADKRPELLEILQQVSHERLTVSGKISGIVYCFLPKSSITRLCIKIAVPSFQKMIVLFARTMLKICIDTVCLVYCYGQAKRVRCLQPHTSPITSRLIITKPNRNMSQTTTMMNWHLPAVVDQSRNQTSGRLTNRERNIVDLGVDLLGPQIKWKCRRQMMKHHRKLDVRSHLYVPTQTE